VRTIARRQHATKWALVIPAIVALAAVSCVLGPGTAQGVPGYAKGVITAKGSIWVNGVEYATGSASITMDDTTGHSSSDLKVGMVVEVKGTIDSATGKGTATEIQYDANLEGPIDTGSINATTQSFTVFGLTINTDANTVYDGVTGFSGLVQGDRVEVSGTADSSTHAIMAARIEVKNTSGNFEIKGIVSGLAAGTFTLTPRHAASGITVNFTGTLAAGIVNGSFVEVKFASFTNPISTTADQIKLLRDLEASDKDRAEVHGVVSNFAAGAGTSTFTVDDVNVSADNSLLSGVANGIQVEVKGTMSSGVLVAESVHVDRESNLVLGGRVSAVDATAGTVTLNGVTLAVTGTTIFGDESSGMLVSTSFSLADIMVGDSIGAIGYTDASVSPAVGVATRVMRFSSLPTALIGGPVSAATTTSLTILGVSVDISTATLKNAGGNTVTASTFVGLITPGTTLAEAIGTWDGSTFTATAAKIGEMED
jgi:hypothetical protein